MSERSPIDESDTTTTEIWELHGQLTAFEATYGECVGCALESGKAVPPKAEQDAHDLTVARLQQLCDKRGWDFLSLIQQA